MDAMIRYEWPGNVRELINCVERAVVLARHENLTLEDLPFSREESETQPPGLTDFGDRPLSEIEKQAVLSTLESTGGNRSEAARRLRITRKTLLKKLKQYNVD
jgi:two-component system response regulator HydG